MQAEARDAVVYPTSDGRPMAENTLQYQWITTLKGNLDASLPDFVAGDLLWYPVEGQPSIRRAPDVLVAFGRPKGHRGSYLQWQEDGVAPQVVIEILSPGNTAQEMSDKHTFYQTYGVQEYLILDPEAGTFQVALRRHGPNAPLLLQRPSEVYESARLGLRFRVDPTDVGPQLRVNWLDGEPLPTFEQLHQDRQQQRDRAEAEARRAEAEARRANSEARRAALATRRAQDEARRAARLAEKLRSLGIDPDDS
ncbi:MAG: Uma2 family endonuclease [Deltaproteobacteria bacterium]|nr:MAG: Uma2 family endonuclease [Deltaproteobacteria bacterium]